MKSILHRFGYGIAAVFLLLGVASPAFAQSDWVNPGTGDWFSGTNWNNGVPTSTTAAAITLGGTSQITSGSGSADTLAIGNEAGEGTLQINGGTLTTANYLVLGYGNKGTLSISGSNSVLAVADHIDIGGNALGEMTISGGSVTSLYGIVAGLGQATISGGRWDVGQNVAVSGTGAMTISGGTVTSNGGYVDGQATISGGRWEVADLMVVGENDGGQMTISGGTVTSDRAIISQYSSGTAMVSSGSWEVAGDIAVGQGATGALNVSGGLVRSGSTVHLGSDTHFGSATLSNNGVIEAQKIVRGTNSGSLTFQNGTIRALADESDFLSGFSSGDVVITHSGTARIDTNGHSVGISAVLSGSGSFTKAGSGTLTLTSVSTYKGVTNVDGGTFMINGDNSQSNAINVNSGAILAGTGLAANVLVQNGGTMAPGGATPGGQLSIAEVSIMNPGSTLLMEFSGTGAGLFDQLSVPHYAVSGNVTLNLQIVGGYVPLVGDSFHILTGGGIEAGGFDHLVTNLGSGLEWNTSQLASNGIVSIAALSIPEPSVSILIVAGLGSMLFFARKRLARR